MVLKLYKNGQTREIKVKNGDYDKAMIEADSLVKKGWSYDSPKGMGNPTTISLDVSSGTIVYNGNIISLHSYLYDPAKDSGLSITTQAKLADLTTQWFQANEHDKKAILSIIRLVRIDINDKSLEQAIDNIVEKGN